MGSVKLTSRERIKYSIRKKVQGTTERPRLSVFKSNKYIYAQLIDDSTGKTIVSSSSLKLDTKGKTKTEVASIVGENLGKLAVDNKIDNVVFDRNGYRYHGRVKNLADGARKAGLKF